jgi:hypothetical protein
VPFNPSDYKLDGAIAMKKLEQSGFPKLAGPSNCMDWEKHFTRAMKLSGHWGFFNGEYAAIPGALGTAWYRRGSSQALEYLRESCTKDKELEIENLVDSSTALEKLKSSSKAIGNSHYCSLQRQFHGTTQASCGTARDFKAAMLNVNRQLAAMHPKYEKPVWEMNSWFINNLTDAYEHKVSALSSNPKVIAVENGMSFDDLCLEIMEEEERLTEKHGSTTTTVATATAVSATLDQTTLAIRLKDLEKQSTDLQRHLKCARCKRTGHSDIVGRKGCWHNPANASFKKEWREARGRSQLGKRSGNNAEDKDGSDSKKRRVETDDYKQSDKPIGVVQTQSYGPQDWDDSE